jgi:GNAT superfamily N-acetyltransferase
MAGEAVTIRPAESRDEVSWRQLWSDFCAFNEVSIPEEATATTWQRILDVTSPVSALVAADAMGSLICFANYVLHPHTWSARTLCYLEDLFVAPEARGRNIGHALIERLLAMGHANGWGRVYWHTHADNERARLLYNRFTLADDLVHYAIQL